MCGRYYVEEDHDIEELLRIIEGARRTTGETVKTGEVFPGDLAPVVANNMKGVPTPFAMRWGYALPQNRVINARSETVRNKPLFKDGIINRRCLVVASYYFEWEKRDKQKIKYAIVPKKGGMITMAGIYRKEPETPLASFVILTRAAAPDISFIHDRMPVILPRAAAAAWLGDGGDWQRALANSEEQLRYAVM